jgi:carbon-monoxide dehydrogenase medium subunit
MKPGKFDYHAPSTLEDALELAAQYGDDARVIAGGQSLAPMMNMRLARPDHLIDINGIGGLAGIRSGSGSVEIGALTRHRQIDHSSELKRLCPLLPAAARNIGHYALRGRGTIGGSLALADPAAEFPLVAALLDADIVARSRNAERAIPAADFFLSVFTTALEPGEIIIAARFRTIGPKDGWGFRWLARRAGDYAIVNAAATLTLGAGGGIGSIAMVLGGVGATSIRLGQLEQASIGGETGEGWAQDIAVQAAQQIEPESDKHASAEFRRELIEVLLAEALEAALARAKGEPVP